MVSTSSLGGLGCHSRNASAALRTPGAANGCCPPSGRSFRVAFAGERVATKASLTTSGSLTARAMNLDPKAFHSWLKQNVFEGQTLTHALRWPAYFSLAIFLLLYLAGRHMDRRQLGRSRKGLLLRGPALISRYRF